MPQHWYRMSSGTVLCSSLVVMICGTSRSHIPSCLLLSSPEDPQFPALFLSSCALIVSGGPDIHLNDVNRRKQTLMTLAIQSPYALITAMLVDQQVLNCKLPCPLYLRDFSGLGTLLNWYLLGLQVQKAENLSITTDLSFWIKTLDFSPHS